MAIKKKGTSKSRRAKKTASTARVANARKRSGGITRKSPSRPKHMPQGYGTVTPFLSARGAAELLDFLIEALGAEKVMSMPGHGDTIMHAEVNIGGSRLMISEAVQGEPTPGAFYLYVPDADALHQRALEAGATLLRPMTDEFWGDRVGMVRDRFGNVWSIATHVEDVSPEELGQRAAAAMNR